MSDAIERAQAVAYLRYRGLDVSDFGAMAAEFASRYYGGLHHFPKHDFGLKKVAWNSDNHLSWLDDQGQVSSFDDSGLTRLVLLAHDLGLRVTIEAATVRRLRITVGKRDVDGCFSGFDRHPTIEETVARWRSHSPPRAVTPAASPRNNSSQRKETP